MGVSSIIGKHVLSAELDCFDNSGVGFGTCDVDIHYEVLPGEESAPFGAFELQKVVMRVAGVSEAVNVTSCFDQSYIEQLIRDEIDGSDYHWTDHGDV